MLHEGVQARQPANADQAAARNGQRADPNAYAVEVTLDNAQRRIPIEADDVIVRKSYHCQLDKEEYMINGKSIREKELFNLFESGGFSLKSVS